MTEYQGRCHCGAVSFAVETGQPIDHGMRCNCSICARKGAMMSQQLFDYDELHIKAEPDAMGLYQFGDKTAKHFFCRNCGIYTFHESGRFPGKHRINLGCIDEIDSLDLPFERFDGRRLL